jgi:predicted DNA-binding transcriptional regulator AlpA
MKLLSFDDLKPVKGIPYSKAQIWRLEKRGAFPRRIPLTDNPNGRHGWSEDEIDAFISERIARRDAASNGGA